MSDFVAQLSQFHFLRPWWLLALFVLPLLIFIAQRSTQNNSSWAQAINPQLLKYLLVDQGERAKKWPLYLFVAGTALCLLALAGPTWKKIPQPVHKQDDALMVVLDLSLSMQANDVKPSRLVATRHKLTDLLKTRQQGQTGLVVYAGDAHVVSPLTDDTDTIIAMVPALSPLIMPALGSRVDDGIETAKEAFKNGGISKGRILLITDGIQEKDISAIQDQLSGAQYELSILVIGTADGGPIPIPEQGFLRDKGDIVIARTDIPRLQQLAQTTGAAIARLSIDDTDINALLPDNAFERNKATREVEREMDQWHEEGPWLLLLILPFAALAFRRGWLLSVVFVVFIHPTQIEAAGWSDQLWQTADQQAAKAFADKNYQTASKLFTKPDWQGSNAYRNGDYQTAADYFSQLDSAVAHYNRGNALAQLGQLGEAIEAYNEALTRNPDFVDAEANKKLIEELAKQQKSDKDSDQNSDQKSKQQQSQSQQSSQQNQSQNQQQDADNSEQTNQQDKSEQDSESEAEKQAAEKNKLDEQKQAKAEQAENDESSQQNESEPTQIEQLSAEEQQAMEQWLRRIPDDPSTLLKRKFNYQYQQNRQNNEFIPQQENETIW